MRAWKGVRGGSGLARSTWSTGRRYARVLPLPVRAVQTRLVPLRASLMAARWTEVGRGKLRREMARGRRGSRPSAGQSRGGGVEKAEVEAILAYR